jgi:hypothetical protein
VNQQRIISLPAAVETFQKEPGAEQNVYDWYRRSGHRSGSVSLGGTDIPVHKRGRAWVIEEACIERAIANLRAERGQMLDDTKAYQRGLLRGVSGDHIRTTWGGYILKEHFHETYRFYEDQRIRRWICNSCTSSAGVKHEKREYHRCEDWGGCGGDCTLSVVFCKHWGTAMQMWPQPKPS